MYVQYTNKNETVHQMNYSFLVTPTPLVSIYITIPKERGGGFFIENIISIKACSS